MKKIFYSLLLVSLCMLHIQAQQLTVGSYNIRYDSSDDAKKGNGWQQRCPVLCQLVTYNDFDVFGAQEVLHNQLNDMLREMPQYGYVGVGRDDGKTAGEYSPIFYKKDKYTVIKSGHFWLSEQTDYPNQGWDAVLPRICTYAELQDKENGMKLWFFNLHMDHVGVEARRESSKLVLKKVGEMCGNDPVIVTGDFNVDQNNESYHVLNNSPLFDDSYEKAAVRYALNGTFNNFNTNIKTDSRIDHIFVSPEFKVERYGILTDTYRSPATEHDIVKSGDFPSEISLEKNIARLPSDHFPVKVILNYQKK